MEKVMHKERLTQMVAMLRSLPPEGLPAQGQERVEFDLGSWNCGTSACAVGHACLSPVFTEQGLAYDRITGDPLFEGRVAWPAVERFFDLSPDRAERLFADWRYENGVDTTPEQVATRIEEFITEHA
jgi:hypothetical protein